MSSYLVCVPERSKLTISTVKKQQKVLIHSSIQKQFLCSLFHDGVFSLLFLWAVLQTSDY